MSATRPVTSTWTADPVYVALKALGEAIEFPRGHVIFAEGEPGDRLYVIQSGKVKLGPTTSGGQENLLGIFGPSDMFGELSIFDPGPRVHRDHGHRDTRDQHRARHPETVDRPPTGPRRADAANPGPAGTPDEHHADRPGLRRCTRSRGQGVAPARPSVRQW